MGTEGEPTGAGIITWARRGLVFSLGIFAGVNGEISGRARSERPVTLRLRPNKA